MKTYIRKTIKNYYVSFPEEIDSNYWSGLIGTTLDDFYDGKWVLLSEELSDFHITHPDASLTEVWNVKLYEAPQRTLEIAKLEKLQLIDEYDNSDNVNLFNASINGTTLSDWFTPALRSNYKNSIEAAEMIELTEVSLYVGENLVTLPIENAKMMLAQIQLYADACYLTTKQHINNILNLTTIEEVDAYDHTSGYPTKLTFNV